MGMPLFLLCLALNNPFSLSLTQHAEVTDKQLKSNDDFVWPIDVPLTGKFIIDVEFLDLKASSPLVSCLSF